MVKVACDKKNFENSEKPNYECRKCGAKVRKEDKVCKPRKINAKE
jgi:hypothetical protein